MDPSGKSSAKGETRMKRFTFEQLIIASAPDQPGKATDAFTNNVMNKIHRDASLKAHVATKPTATRASFFYRLRHLPTLAVIAIAFVTILAITGTAYALTQLWAKPIVHIQTPVKSAAGRVEVIASLQNCGNEAAKQTIEVKKMSTIDPSEIQKILQARCEVSAVQQALAPQDSSAIPQIPVDGRIVEQTALQNASSVLSLSKDTLQSKDGRTNTLSAQEVTPATKYVVNGLEGTASDIRPGDTILYTLYTKYRQHVGATSDPTRFTTSPEELEKRVTYIVKANLPIEYYGADKQGQIAQITSCFGNEMDSCAEGGVVDLYQDNGNNPLSSEITSRQAVMREIQLKLMSVNGTRITGISTSGRQFSVALPVDAIKTFNTTRSSGYNHVIIGIGDTVLIRYYELASQNDTTVSSDRVEYAGFLVEMIHENDPIKKY